MVTRELRQDGYRGGVIENLTGRQQRWAMSSAVLLGTSAAATSAVRFFHTDSLRPCRESCTVSAFVFQVPGIP